VTPGRASEFASVGALPGAAFVTIPPIRPEEAIMDVNLNFVVIRSRPDHPARVRTFRAFSGRLTTGLGTSSHPPGARVRVHRRYRDGSDPWLAIDVGSGPQRGGQTTNGLSIRPVPRQPGEREAQYGFVAERAP
jgi:hypothetical protein